MLPPAYSSKDNMNALITSQQHGYRTGNNLLAKLTRVTALIVTGISIFRAASDEDIHEKLCIKK
jgi:hypothetical protein